VNRALLSPEFLAVEINNLCDNFRYVVASGLVRETVGLWQGREHLLNDVALVFLHHYREAA
jgi:hypothetical protein